MITDLDELLRSMRPSVRPGRYVYATVADVPASAQAFVAEDEGLSVVLAQADADALGLSYDFVAAWISLTVHSDLAAVGLTAAVSAALTEVGISCNVIAGYHHDDSRMIGRRSPCTGAVTFISSGTSLPGTLKTTGLNATIGCASLTGRPAASLYGVLIVTSLMMIGVIWSHSLVSLCGTGAEPVSPAARAEAWG